MPKNRNKRATMQAKDIPWPKWFIGNLFTIIRKHGNVAVRWFGIGWIAHEVSLAFIAYAGRTSIATLNLGILANISVVWGLSITVSGLSITLYVMERNLHRKTRDRLTDRITELELKLDPSRTSSLLTPEGLTRKEDE